MYDFYLGSENEIANDEIKFLIAIKRMMPRWVNSIPDTEFVTLTKLLDGQGAACQSEGRKLVIVETGVGASSLASIFYALKYNGTAFCWDLNGEKGSLIRTICTETMGNYFHKHIDGNWQFLSFDSTSPFLGLPILNDLVDHVDLFFHDSEHVWVTIEKELQFVMPLLIDGSIVSLDDVNLNFLHTNIAYINTFRRKLNLPFVENTQENKTQPFYQKVEQFLIETWHKVENLSDLYKEKSYDDLSNYYNAEFAAYKTIRKEHAEDFKLRFGSWRISHRR